MALGSLRSLSLEINLDAHGLAATVTRPAPDNTPITTTGIWLRSEELPQPFGTDIRRRDPRLRLALPKSDVPDAPRGTTIRIAAHDDDTERDWVVEGYDGTEANHLRVLLTPAP